MSLKELAAVTAALARYRPATFDLEGFCFPKQLAFVRDPAAFATAVNSRRSGKTYGCVGDLISTALAPPNAPVLYITLTRSNAKMLIWPTLKRVNQQYRLGGVVNESELSMTFSNGPIYLAGVNTRDEIEKFRGLALKLVYLDEAQAMRPYVKELIDDVLAPALVDHNGRLRVTGTPGAAPVGYFHDIATSPVWAHHFWTLFDNPHIEAEKRLELELVRRGVTRDDPSIQREFYGRWVSDLNALVIRYNPDLNDFAELPPLSPWQHVFGVDLGFEDSDAIAVIAFADRCPSAYLVHEVVRAKQGISELAGELEVLIDRYQPVKIRMDEGGLGKKLAEEMRRRYGIPIEPAEKERKFAAIEILNDGLRTGRFMAKRSSTFAADSMLLEWDREDPLKPKISDRFHSDIIDAVLYGYREAQHWTNEALRPQPPMGSIEHMKIEEEEAWKRAAAALDAEREQRAFWSDPFE